MTEQKKIKIGLGSFDLIKGIAILSVIYLHAGWDSCFSNIVNIVWKSFLGGFMPMFFILNGYGFKKKPIMKMLKKTGSDFLVPYFLIIPMAIFLHFICNMPLYPDVIYGFQDVKNYVISFLHGRDCAGPLWFFLALFIANNTLNLILAIKEKWMRIICVVFSVTAGFAVMHTGFCFFRIVEGLTAVGFSYIGYVLKEKRLLEKAYTSIWGYLILVPLWVFQVLILSKGGMILDMYSSEYTLLQFFLAGGIGLLLICIGLMLNRIKWNGMEFFRKCGMYSYWILMVHTIDMIAVPWHDLLRNNSLPLLEFAIELGLRVWIIVIGCTIIKMISQIRYRQRLERKGKEYSV